MRQTVKTLIRWNEHPSIRAELQDVIDSIESAGGRCRQLIDSGGVTGPDTKATEHRIWMDDLPFPKGL